MQYTKFIFGAHLTRFANRFSVLIIASGVFAMTAHLVIRSKHFSYWSMTENEWLNLNAGMIVYFIMGIFGGLFLAYHKSPKHRPHPKSTGVPTIDAALLYRWWFRLRVEARLTIPLNDVHAAVARETKRLESAIKIREALIADTEQSIEDLPEASSAIILKSSAEDIIQLDVEIADAESELEKAKKRLEKLNTHVRSLFLVSTNRVEPLIFALTRSKERRVKMRIEHEINATLKDLLAELEPVRQDWQTDGFWDTFEPMASPAA
ncbi:MAG: hypothetical protein NT003_04140 [Candidatus Magasanikbacteria bacterium]|nr:hypothetical protein [Candidatus Magasanikbacteria bacterium]